MHVQNKILDKESLQQEKYVQVLLCKEHIFIPFSQVQEVAEISHITKVPGFTSWFLGFCLVRGNILPVFDIRDILFPKRALDSVVLPLQAIISEMNEKRFCIVIEATQGIVEASYYIENSLLLSKLLRIHCLKGIAKLGDILGAVVDVFFLYEKIEEQSIEQ